MPQTEFIELNGISTPVDNVLFQAALDEADYVHVTAPGWGGDRATIISDVKALKEHFTANRGKWHNSRVYDLTGDEPVLRGASEVRYGVLEKH